MTKDQRKEIIDVMCDSIKEHLLNKIAVIPDNWDAVELREWFADTTRDQLAYKKMDKARLKEYQNDVIINNL